MVSFLFATTARFSASPVRPFAWRAFAKSARTVMIVHRASPKLGMLNDILAGLCQRRGMP